MWLIAALVVEATAQHIIQIGSKDFVGEDAVLSQLLKARIDPGNKNLAFPSMPKQYFDNMRLINLIAEDHGSNQSRRFYGEPPEIEQKKRLIEVMQHNIYVTQYRLLHLKNITDKYANDIRFRVATIFCRLDTLIKEMRTLYTYINKTLSYYEYPKRSVYDNLLYYTHILKRNVDVTYIVEHMIDIHTKYMEKFKTVSMTPPRSLGTGSPPPGGPGERPPSPRPEGPPGGPPGEGSSDIGPSGGPANGPPGEGPQDDGSPGGPAGGPPGGPPLGPPGDETPA